MFDMSPDWTTSVATECLDFRRGHVRLCGRESELSILDVAYTRTTALENPTATSVFIRGESGSGKSALVRQFRKLLIKRNDPDLASCVFCRGKFEQGGAAAQPFSTVLTACVSMVQQLLDGPVDPDIWKRRFTAELSTQDSAIVQNMIPSLRNLLRSDLRTDSGTHASTSDVAPVQPPNATLLGCEQLGHRRGSYTVPEYIPTNDIFDPSDTEFSFDRLRFALRSFIRTVSRFIPLVLFLDDMQWAGEDSLMLIETLVYDTMPGRRLLLLGAYRPVVDDHPLSLRVLNEPMNDRQIARRETDQVNQPMYLCLENLDSTATGELIASVLKINDEQEVTSLVPFVYGGTTGNPFFILQLLHLLETKRLVFFSKETGRWTWQNGDGLREVESIHVVREIVNQRILCLPPAYQHVISCAACLGALQFSVSILVLTLDSSWKEIPVGYEALELDHFDKRSKDLYRTLGDIVEAGFLEQVGNAGEFKFVHDRLLEAAYSLFVQDDRKQKHLSIGRRLVRVCQSDMLRGSKPAFHIGSDFEEEVMLQAVNQMNLGASLLSNITERRMVAEMNYVVAKMAISRSAYFPAADFLSIGLSVLSGATTESLEWQRSYPLMLKLSVEKAKIDYCCSSWTSALRHADAVLSHATSVYDKAQAYLTKVLILKQDGRVLQTKALILFILKELGISFPPEKIRCAAAIVEVLRVKTMLSKYSNNELSRLKESDDHRANLSSDFFAQLISSTFTAHADRELLILAIMRAVRQSLTNGMFRLSCVGFVYYGAVLAHLGKYSEAYRYGKIGLELVATDGHYAVLATTMFHTYISHWQYPIHHSIGPLAKLVKHFSYSDYYMTVYQEICFAAGRRLHEMKLDILQNAEALLDYKEYVFYDFYSPLFQLVSILTRNRIPSSMYLSGEYMDERELLEQSKPVRAKIHIYLFKLYLVCLFGDLGSERELFATMKKLQRLQAPNSNFRLWNFLIGLLSFALARSSSNYYNYWRYKRKGRAMLCSMINWESQGVGNASFFRLMLQAEHEAMSCRQGRSSPPEIEQVLKLYGEAIDMMVNLSADYYFHLRALANEKAAVFCLEHDLAALASRYMIQARDLYAEWGAVAKVIQLNEKYRELLAAY